MPPRFQRSPAPLSRAWLERARALRSWQRGNQRAPHKPLLLLYLLGRFQQTGTHTLAFAEASGPLSALQAEFGPPARSLHPEYPFYHLQRDGFWRVEPALEVPAGGSPSAAALRERGAGGRLDPSLVAALQQDPPLLVHLARVLLDASFPSSLHADVCAAVGLDLAPVELGQPPEAARDPAFREAVLLAYAYQCAVRGYDGQVLRQPAGLEAAHVRWWSMQGPSTVDNGVCLCSLHHKLLDLGVLGVSDDHRVLVSQQFVGRGAGTEQLVLRFSGRPLLLPQAGQPRVAPQHLTWHRRQVFRPPARPSMDEAVLADQGGDAR